jgi:hypothetical protein
MNGLKFGELCQMVGKDAVYVRNLQKHLHLHIPRKDGAYPQSYALFLEKVISLRAFHVPVEAIRDLFEVEKKLLCLLHVDTLTSSPTWYLDDCTSLDVEEPQSDRLLLSGHRLGFAPDTGSVQPTLDFGERHPELFTGKEMGENLGQVLRKYLALRSGIRDRIEREKPILENAMYWVERVFR